MPQKRLLMVDLKTRMPQKELLMADLKMRMPQKDVRMVDLEIEMPHWGSEMANLKIGLSQKCFPCPIRRQCGSPGAHSRAELSQRDNCHLGGTGYQPVSPGYQPGETRGTFDIP